MKNTRTILQVEDDQNDVFLFQHAMRKVGVTNPIQVANDGQEAIDYLAGTGKFADREAFPLPCLVLLDLKLPYVMGLDVLRWIRQQPGAARIVVLLSASGGEADIATAYRLGANGYLVKPTEASEFQNMVRAIKDFWLTQNTPPPDVPMEEKLRRYSGQTDMAERGLAHINQANGHSQSAHHPDRIGSHL
jgi:two-component system response regulator